MPFCCQCGKPVAPHDAFCGVCGARQEAVPPSKAGAGAFSDISARNASLLCYIPFVGWIPAIVVLASNRFQKDRDVRFHAFQGLYLFVAWLVVDWAVSPFLHLSRDGFRFGPEILLKLAVFCTWIFMLVKTAQNELFRLPLLGELADRSVAEQR